MTKAQHKEPWDKKAGTIIDKCGRAIRSLWDILYKIIKQLIETVNYLVTLLTNLIVEPTTTIFFCLGMLIVVTLVTAYQWFEVGVWVGTAIGTTTFLGWTLGFFGMIGGLFLNIEELSPELHKINENLAAAFKNMGVKFDHTPQPDNLEDRLKNWFSYDMAFAKKGRWISYLVETAIVVVYVAATGLTVTSVAVAFVALTCPELAIKYLRSKVSLFATASALANQEEEQKSVRNFGGTSAKGGFDDFAASSGKKERF